MDADELARRITDAWVLSQLRADRPIARRWRSAETRGALGGEPWDVLPQRERAQWHGAVTARFSRTLDAIAAARRDLVRELVDANLAAPLSTELASLAHRWARGEAPPGTAAVLTDALAERGRSLRLDHAPPPLRGGRLMMYDHAENLNDGAGQPMTDGFFDDKDLPPWDLWLACAQDGDRVRTVVWIPPDLPAVHEQCSWDTSVFSTDFTSWLDAENTPLRDNLHAQGWFDNLPTQPLRLSLELPHASDVAPLAARGHHVETVRQIWPWSAPARREGWLRLATWDPATERELAAPPSPGSADVLIVGTRALADLAADAGWSLVPPEPGDPATDLRGPDDPELPSVPDGAPRVAHVPPAGSLSGRWGPYEPPRDTPWRIALLGPQTAATGADLLVEAVAGLDIVLYVEAAPRSLARELRDQAEARGVALRLVDRVTACDAVAAPTRKAGVGRYRADVRLIRGLDLGVPTVGANLPAVGEVIKHRVTGLLHAPDNPGDLRHQLQLLIEHPDRAARLAEAARKRAAAYTPGERARRLEYACR